MSKTYVVSKRGGRATRTLKGRKNKKGRIVVVDKRMKADKSKNKKRKIRKRK